MLTIVNYVICFLVKIDQSEEKSANFIKFKTCDVRDEQHSIDFDDTVNTE